MELEKLISSFKAKFVHTPDIRECADLINTPHEDYPHRVTRTEDMIQTVLNAGLTEIDNFHCKSIHSHVMHDLPDQRGMWRLSNVSIVNKNGIYHPPPPHMIEDELTEAGLFPMRFMEMDEPKIITWYEEFQKIHPFIDGNGRVGGIIVAVASFVNFNYFLAPMQ